MFSPTVRVYTDAEIDFIITREDFIENYGNMLLELQALREKIACTAGAVACATVGAAGAAAVGAAGAAAATGAVAATGGGGKSISQIFDKDQYDAVMHKFLSVVEHSVHQPNYSLARRIFFSVVRLSFHLFLIT